MSKHNTQKNFAYSHVHLSRHLDTLETSVQEALKEELAEEFGDLCEEYGGVEGFVGLTQQKGSIEGRRTISRVREKGLKLTTDLLDEQREMHLLDRFFKHDDLEIVSYACLKKAWKCLPKQAPISGSYPEHLYLMYVVLETCYGEGIGRNHVERLNLDALSDDEILSKLSGESDDDMTESLSDGKSSTVSSVQILDNCMPNKTINAPIKTSISSLKRSTSSSTCAMMMHSPLKKSKIILSSNKNSSATTKKKQRVIKVRPSSTWK